MTKGGAARRIFTTEEKDLMVRQSRGEFSMHYLERILKTGRDSIVACMAEMGIQPVIKKQIGPKPKQEYPVPQDAVSFAPTVGNKDKLLEALRKRHSKRSY